MELLRNISDLMDISKLDVGQMKIFETNGNLSETFNQLQSYYESALETIEGKHDIQIIPRYNISPGNSLITTDFVRLNQILTNLIDNAIKFTSNGSVEYGCSIQGDRLEFYVKDTGIGIPADKMSIIFERFRQADETTTRLFGGSGLGLAISKGLLSLMNGDIRVESEENKGSTFRFSLPYKPARIIAEETSDEKKVSYNWERNKLLIIEDDFANIKYITEILSDKKCRHSFAKSGSDALMYLKENPGTDLILLDIRLPDMNGVTLAKTISDTYKNIRIIAQTAFATQNDRMACLNAGCIDYISKPYSQKALTEIIEKHLR